MIDNWILDHSKATYSASEDHETTFLGRAGWGCKFSFLRFFIIEDICINICQFAEGLICVYCSLSAFMGVVGQVKDMNAWKRITFKITSVYKKGQKNLNAGDKISVYISSSCEYPKVTVSQKFIVMLKDGNKYLLDKTSAILEWPKEEAKRNKVQLALDEVKKGKVCDEF